MVGNNSPAMPDPQEYLRALARRLRQTRELSDGNRMRVAEEFGVHHTTWQKWERGEREPDSRVMVAFCTKWKVTMDWLYRGDMRGLDPYMQVLLYRKYPDLLEEALARAAVEAPEMVARLGAPPPLPEPPPPVPQTRRRRSGRGRADPAPNNSADPEKV